METQNPTTQPDETVDAHNPNRPPEPEPDPLANTRLVIDESAPPPDPEARQSTIERDRLYAERKAKAAKYAEILDADPLLALLTWEALRPTDEAFKSYIETRLEEIACSASPDTNYVTITARRLSRLILDRIRKTPTGGYIPDKDAEPVMPQLKSYAMALRWLDEIIGPPPPPPQNPQPPRRPRGRPRKSRRDTPDNKQTTKGETP